MPELTWIGKDKVITHHLDVPFRVLERKYSFDEAGRHAEDNGSENMIIHGDNLEALKALLPRFEGKIDCIYIDPPYNTGNEQWVYNDNVNDPQIKKWLGEVVGKEGDDLSRHDKWLCMMYPRLRLLKYLLARTGAIFISIDDNEASNLKAICDEIFGSGNFVASVTVVNNLKGRSDKKHIATAHEQLLIYGGSDFVTNGVPSPDAYDREYKFEDDRGRFRLQGLRKRGSNAKRSDRPNMYYPFYFEPETNTLDLYCKSSTCIEILPRLSDGQDGCWRWGRETAMDRLSELTVRQVSRRNEYDVFQKDYLPPDSKRRIKPKSVWTGPEFSAERGTLQIKQIFGNRAFDTPKSIELVEYCLEQAAGPGALVLDSFAGSGTTAHAVLRLNTTDGANRRFILIELGEYAETLTAERVNRVVQGYGNGQNQVEGTGGGYSFFELSAPLLVDGLLNTDVTTQAIREFIWFTETHSTFAPVSSSNRYYLGTHQNTAYHLLYERDKPTNLNRAYLSSLPREERSSSLVIFADTCSLSESDMVTAGVTFKKIPRDITKL